MIELISLKYLTGVERVKGNIKTCMKRIDTFKGTNQENFTKRKIYPKFPVFIF